VKLKQVSCNNFVKMPLFRQYKSVQLNYLLTKGSATRTYKKFQQEQRPAISVDIIS